MAILKELLIPLSGLLVGNSMFLLAIMEHPYWVQLLVLDLQTKEWRRLGGTMVAPKNADLSIPGLQKKPQRLGRQCSKNSAANKLNGECDLMGTQYIGELYGGVHGHPYDFRSWGIELEK